MMFTKWIAETGECSCSNKLFEQYNIQEYENAYEEFKKLPKEQRGKGLFPYINTAWGIDISIAQMNYIKIQSEINQQLNSASTLKILPIDYLTHSKAISDILSSFEDESYIKDIYKKKKLNMKGELKTETATTLVNCIKQGHSLLDAGQQADILAKPLINFYAASAYVYAIIVINSPIHKSLDSLKGSHGHIYDPNACTINFGGDIPRGTFLDLMCSLFIAHVITDDIAIQYPLLNSILMLQNNKINLSLPALLSMIPEIQNYYLQFDNEHKCVHEIKIDTKITSPNNVDYNFYIGNGIEKPSYNNLQAVFKTDNIHEQQGAYKIVISSLELSNIIPTIYQDMQGTLWYIDSPISMIHLPEICLHFLIISALSNIMRYSPHKWNMIINNKISPSFSLLITRYLRLFEQKFPMLIIQYFSNYLPIMQ